MAFVNPSRAECVGSPEVFFPERVSGGAVATDEAVERAVLICRGCPELELCRELYESVLDTAGHGRRARERLGGVWAGQTALAPGWEERQAKRRARA